MILIAALDRRNAIGKHNALPWHLPRDLKRFKALTLGKTVVMGRKTAESLGRALPDRRNLVLTRSGRAPFAEMQPIDSLEAISRIVGAEHVSEVCVIGGAEIYALLLPHVTCMYLTHVDTVIEGADVFFPPFNPQHWRIESQESYAADAKHAFGFSFFDYCRCNAS
ncbi:MAG: dihydrofolate reductase [Xanthomonadaceae bacterium]|jgi:dihydrofolate reductase|nr:dihydrofolate reductase [Xanthomonadaceae bacterium]